jgi:hypothetical protein
VSARLAKLSELGSDVAGLRTSAAFFQEEMSAQLAKLT